MPSTASASTEPPVGETGDPLLALRRQLAQLEQNQGELEAFTAAVAHDLRTPLSAMDGFCSLLLQTLAEMPQPEARQCEHFAGRLRSGLGRMGEMVEALLQLSRSVSQPLVGQWVDLSRLALEVMDGLYTRHPGRPHHVSVQPGLQAWGDRALLRQVLENLLGNAWKFSQACERVDIEFGHLPAEAGGAYFVRDAGAGFDMQRAGQLFQPFERLHSQSEFPGTGIGLATVRRIVARHAGQVRAESHPGQGATFFFTLGAPA